MNYQENYIKSAVFEFQRYKTLGDKTFGQLEEKDIDWAYTESDNSIGIIVKVTIQSVTYTLNSYKNSNIVMKTSIVKVTTY